MAWTEIARKRLILIVVIRIHQCAWDLAGKSGGFGLKMLPYLYDLYYLYDSQIVILYMLSIQLRHISDAAK